MCVSSKTEKVQPLFPLLTTIGHYNWLYLIYYFATITQYADNLMAVQNAAMGEGRGGKKRGYDPHNDNESHGMGGGESHDRSGKGGKSDNKSGKGGGKRHGKSGGKSHSKSGGKSHGKWSGSKAKPTTGHQKCA